MIMIHLVKPINTSYLIVTFGYIYGSSSIWNYHLVRCDKFSEIYESYNDFVKIPRTRNKIIILDPDTREFFLYVGVTKLHDIKRNPVKTVSFVKVTRDIPNISKVFMNEEIIKLLEL